MLECFLQVVDDFRSFQRFADEDRFELLLASSDDEPTPVKPAKPSKPEKSAKKAPKQKTPQVLFNLRY